MKVSMDHYFSSCSGCPFVQKKNEEVLGMGQYVCRLGKMFVSGEMIDPFCPLKNDEQGKIYTKYAEDIQ